MESGGYLSTAPPFPPADEATLEKASWSLLKDMKRITDSDAKGKCSERARECFQKLREVTAGDPWSGGQDLMLLSP